MNKYDIQGTVVYKPPKPEDPPAYDPAGYREGAVIWWYGRYWKIIRDVWEATRGGFAWRKVRWYHLISRHRIRKAGWKL